MQSIHHQIQHIEQLTISQQKQLAIFQKETQLALKDFEQENISTIYIHNPDSYWDRADLHTAQVTKHDTSTTQNLPKATLSIHKKTPLNTSSIKARF